MRRPDEEEGKAGDVQHQEYPTDATAEEIKAASDAAVATQGLGKGK